jgi:hypothetical protein
MLDKFKEFKPTSWAIDNKTSVYIMTIISTLAGIFAYNKLQKENFPDIVIPTMMVATVYPGTSPSDIENLVTRPIEKQIKSLSGVKRVKSTSNQDYSLITVEFNTGYRRSRCEAENQRCGRQSLHGPAKRPAEAAGRAGDQLFRNADHVREPFRRLQRRKTEKIC